MADLSGKQLDQMTIAAYEVIAPIYERDHPPHWKDDLYYGLISTVSAGTVLDVGCGTARDGLSFLEDGWRYIGVDLSSAMLDIARSRYQGDERVSFASMNMRDLGIRDKSVDALCAASSLTHIPRREFADVLAEFRRVLKDGGRALVSVPHGDFEGTFHLPEYGVEAYCTCWRPDPLVSVFQESGFELIDGNVGATVVILAQKV